MKRILQLVIVLMTISIVNSCSKDNEDYIYTNSVLIGDKIYDINGGILSYTPELQEDYTWKHNHEITFYGDGLKFDPSTGFSGKGFMFVAKLHTASHKLPYTSYLFNKDESPSTFYQSGYSTTFDIDSNTNDLLTIMQNGVIDIQWSNEKYTINFSVIGDDGIVIKGLFEGIML